MHLKNFIEQPVSEMIVSFNGSSSSLKGLCMAGQQTENACFVGFREVVEQQKKFFKGMWVTVRINFSFGHPPVVAVLNFADAPAFMVNGENRDELFSA